MVDNAHLPSHPSINPSALPLCDRCRMMPSVTTFAWGLWGQKQDPLFLCEACAEVTALGVGA